MLPATTREPNGQLSRRIEAVQAREYENEKDAMDVAVSTRIRQHNIVEFRRKDGKIVTAEEQARDPRRGYVLGLLLIDGRITKPQHDAGLRYAEDLARYYGLTGIQFPSPRAQSLFSVPGDAGESEAKIKAAGIARSKAKRLRDVLLATGDIDTGRRVEHTVRMICLIDLPESRAWPEHMIGWLRRGLNRLAGDHYGMNS